MVACEKHTAVGAISYNMPSYHDPFPTTTGLKIQQLAYDVFYYLHLGSSGRTSEQLMVTSVVALFFSVVALNEVRQDSSYGFFASQNKKINTLLLEVMTHASKY